MGTIRLQQFNYLNDFYMSNIMVYVYDINASEVLSNSACNYLRNLFNHQDRPYKAHILFRKTYTNGKIKKDIYKKKLEKFKNAIQYSRISSIIIHEPSNELILDVFNNNNGKIKILKDKCVTLSSDDPNVKSITFGTHIDHIYLAYNIYGDGVWYLNKYEDITSNLGFDQDESISTEKIQKVFNKYLISQERKHQ